MPPHLHPGCPMPPLCLQSMPPTCTLNARPCPCASSPRPHTCTLNAMTSSGPSSMPSARILNAMPPMRPPTCTLNTGSPTCILNAMPSSGPSSGPGSGPPASSRGDSSLATAGPYTARILSSREAPANVVRSVRDSPCGGRGGELYDTSGPAPVG